MKRSHFLVALAVVAFLIRLAAVLALRDITKPPTLSAFGTDALHYDNIGQHVARGDGYVLHFGKPNVYRPPGFPLYLAAIYLLGAPRYPAAYLSFCALGALACVLTCLLAREVLSEATARTAGILSALYVPHIYFATLFASENLYVVCLAVGIWQLIRHQKTGSLPALAASGLALGWGALTRPPALALLPFVAGALLWSQLRRLGLRWAPWLLLALTFLAPTAAWTARNYAVTGRLWFASTTSGATFFRGNNPLVVGSWLRLGAPTAIDGLPGRREEGSVKLDPVARDRERLRSGLRWLLDNPTRIPLLALAKLVQLWMPDTLSPNPRYGIVSVLTSTPFLVLIGLGAFHCLRHRRYWTELWLALHAPVLATMAVAVVFFGYARFRDANTPILMIDAAIGLRRLLWGPLQRVGWLGERRPRRGPSRRRPLSAPPQGGAAPDPPRAPQAAPR